MSCFVIEKKDYMRFAGAMSALAKKEGYYDTFISKIKEFCRILYENNVDNVCGHYEDETNKKYLDKNEYQEEFDQGYKDMWDILDNYQNDSKKALSRCESFLSSIHYQSCDDDKCDKKCIVVSGYLWELIAKGYNIGYEKSSYWGDFDINDLVKYRAKSLCGGVIHQVYEVQRDENGKEICQ